MSKRKKYPKEFKLDAVSLVSEQGYTRTEAAKSLSINSNMLGRWIKEAESEEGQSFRGNGKLTAEQEQIRDLRKRVKRLEMEKDILKNLPPNAFSFCRKRNGRSCTLIMYPEAEAVRFLVA